MSTAGLANQSPASQGLTAGGNGETKVAGQGGLCQTSRYQQRKYKSTCFFQPTCGMVLIPAGTFTIGDTLDGESNAITTNVYVSAFYMDTNLVSLSQWQGVYSYATNHGYSFVEPGKDKAANYPVETVDWYDCVKWSNARSAQAGLTPVYYTDGLFTQVYTNGETDAVYPNWAANGYRLPTEAEREKASRGGLSGQRFPWGNLITENLGAIRHGWECL